MITKQTGRITLPLQVALTLLVIAGLAAVIYLPQLLQDAPPKSRILSAAPGCNLNTALSCQASSEDRSIQLSFKDGNFHSMQPLPVEVVLKNIPADQVMLDLQGRDMYMGLNQNQLSPVAGKPGHWRGEITLAVCTTGEMIWKASVVTGKARQTHQADFFFTAR